MEEVLQHLVERTCKWLCPHTPQRNDMAAFILPIFSAFKPYRIQQRNDMAAFILPIFSAFKPYRIQQLEFLRSMSLPDATEVRRISAQLKALEKQRAEGSLTHENIPLRLYSVRSGGFVRVLDKRPEPISQDMMKSIEAYINKCSATSELEVEETATTQENKEIHEIRQNCEDDGANVVAQHEQQMHKDQKECFAIEVGANAVLTVSTIDNNGDVAASSVSKELPSSWASASTATTPQILVAQNELVSKYLGKQIFLENYRNLKPEKFAQLSGYLNKEAKKELRNLHDHLSMFEQWPQQLEERRKVWYTPQIYVNKTNGVEKKPQPVVYWMHNTFRVMHGNFGLEAAILLSKRLNEPLVVVSLIISSIIYPICHSSTASDAYARFSLVELHQHFSHAGVPFFGLTAMKPKAVKVANGQKYLPLESSPIYDLLDALKPVVVVTDAMFDFSSRSDLVHLARFLDIHRLSCSWPLLSMDSVTCYPVYQLSETLRGSFEGGADFTSEEQFGIEYASFAIPHNETYNFSPLAFDSKQYRGLKQQCYELLSPIMQRLDLEEVNWRLVKAENSQSSCQVRQFCESEGLQKLSTLLSNSNGLPTIQAELRGGGVLSLLPFIRHGTIFAGYVLQRISEAIELTTPPVNSKERKALAMRKVMRSRAANHLGRERDYALYLALWCAVNGERSEHNGNAHIDPALLLTSKIIASLDIYAPRMTSLNIYEKILPSWALTAAKIGAIHNEQRPGAALYDPSELESAQTQDTYWNEIQTFLVKQQFLHPLLIIYWAYRLMTWSVSTRAAIATIDTLLNQYAVGSNTSPDAVFIVWKELSRIGSKLPRTKANISKEDDLQQFQRLIEIDIASQTKLNLHS
ncbi:hypothetical protein CCR75_003879 [Bremia lactucae]|uniref:Uncharacterized protein n=1 Tax=Bremia lactucae TaxID=4779 RepID=A0A976IHU8_BRELC|nr:hypothetical protein CCR75_003879 [Bremia lactucae]